MADTKELDAIFKSPRNTKSPTTTAANITATATNAVNVTGTSTQHPMVVTPAKTVEEEEEVVPSTSTSTMITNLPPNQDPEFHHLQHPFPLDDRQYSIPSIRLANAVFHRSDSLASYDMSQRTFSDEDESTWEGSYLGEDDDVDTEASWSTTGGGGGSISSLRRRNLMRHLSSGGMSSSSLVGMRHLNSTSEGGGQPTTSGSTLEGLRHLNSSTSEGRNSSSSIPTPPAIAPSNSFMER